MKKFVILGGGSAGWITALFVKKAVPDASVTLVQSKEIGIIGVGEATTPHVIRFLKDQDIDPLDLIRVTKGTIKNGINFANWNGDGKRYFHDFYESIIPISVDNFYTDSGDDFFKQFLINNKLPFEDYMYQMKLAYQNKVDLLHTNYALHFDSVKFADYLENIGRSRNINIVDDILQCPVLDDRGFIKKLRLQSGQELNCDFVFDCTGFARVLIGKLYESKWHSYSNFLPAKKAIPFWLENKEELAPYTDSIAMKNGWMWNIPLQHRIGAGYVFDSDYISVDQAKQEVEEYLKHDIDVRKVISFEPGRFDAVWIKNCLSIGLSSNFLEPLESTSLWIAIMQLNQFKMYMNEIDDPHPKSQKMYNKMVSDAVDISANFIHLHYLTKRNDSKFWLEFREKNKTPDMLKETLSLIDNSIIRSIDVVNYHAVTFFPLHSYLVVANGLEMFTKKFNLSYFENFNPSINQYKNMIEELCTKAPYHKDLITHLQKGPV